MKYGDVKFVSTGGIFDYKIGNSSVLIGGKIGTILIDCGYTVYSKLVELDVISEIDYICITHLHGDHIGSIHPLVLHLANRCKKKVKIIYPTELFCNLIKQALNPCFIDIERYVDFVPIDNIANIGFVDTTNSHVLGMVSYAYYFWLHNSCVFFSGDLGKLSVTEEFIKRIECDNLIIFHETSFIKGSAHVYYKELMKLSNRYTVYAYHCNHLNIPVDCNLKFVANIPEYCFQEKENL